jgi:hypothetical protein
MRTAFARRGGVAAATLGATAALMLGFSGPASAAVLYQNDNANVRVSGGEAIAFNACIADAKDGVIQQQQVACNQIATAGNAVILDNVYVLVTPAGQSYPILFQKNNVNVTVSGGLAAAANLCVADAKDGVIQQQQVACNQFAAAGNMVVLSGVAVAVAQ